MSSRPEDAERAAVEWLVAVGDPAFTDWEGWDAWMAADSLHAEIYWRLEARESALADGLRTEGFPPGEAVAAAPARTRRMLFGGMAAAVIVLAALYLAFPKFAAGNGAWALATAAGERRELRLADGSFVQLNGETSIRGDRSDPRRLRLDRGQVTMTVKHDPARPFVLQVDDAVVRDLGTMFDVAATGDGLRIAVGEGIVEYEGRGRRIRLEQGQAVDVAGASIRRHSVVHETVGSWRDGRLSYEDAALVDVASDVGRSLGVNVRLSDALKGRRFSGSFRVDSGAEAMRPRVARLLNVRIAAEGTEWLLLPASPRD